MKFSMVIKYIAKYRHAITAIVAVLFIGSMVYFGIRTKNMKDVSIESQTFSGLAMGTAIKKTLYTEDASQNESIDKMIDSCLTELEGRISVREAGSEVASCNRNYAVNGIYTFSDDIMEYLKEEFQIWEDTKGAFSPCIRPLADLWGIEDGEARIPEPEEIEAALKCINAENVEIVDSGIIFYEERMAIDFGAVGKGIACDLVREKLQGTNVRGAVISVGGSVLAYGDKGDGRNWHIGIQNPRAEEGKMFAVLDVEGGVVISTSGDYEKYFEQNGKRYHHIIDPATGYPVDNGLISVTVISESGFLSDALSTACFVMGTEKGLKYAEKKGVEAVFVTTDKKVYITSGLKKKFRLQSEEYQLENK